MLRSAGKTISGAKTRDVLCRSHLFTGLEQAPEILFGIGAWSNRAKLNIANVAACFCSRSNMTDSQRHQLTVIAYKNCVAEVF